MLAALEAARFQEMADDAEEDSHDGDMAGLKRAAALGQGLPLYARSVAMYRAAFQQDDKGWDSLAPDEEAARINQRAIREELVDALQEWGAYTSNQDEGKRLDAIMEAADPDPGSFQNRRQVLCAKNDWDGLYRLAFGPEAKDVSTARLVSVGRDLYDPSAASVRIKFFKEANEQRPGNFWIAIELASACRSLEGFTMDSHDPGRDEVIRYLTAAVMLRPDYAAAHYQLGSALRNDGRLDEAITEYRMELKIEPGNAGAHTDIGDALARNEDQLDKAITEYRDALKIQPHDARTHTQLGTALAHQQHWDEAITEFRNALLIQPDDFSASHNLANALENDGQWDEAITEFRKILKTHPDSAFLHTQLGTALAHHQHWDDAIMAYRKAFQIEPENENDYYHAACLVVLVGCGQGTDGATADDKQRSRWRQQALDWLRAALNLRTKEIDDAKPDHRAAKAEWLRVWQQDPDLAGVRDQDALAKLPADEQDAWRQFWADVDGLRKKALEK